MSKFKTCIPVDVDAIKALLPSNSFIHGVTWNPEASQVELQWENDRLKTPYTFSVDFPIESLKAKQVVAGVTVLPDPNGGTTQQKAVATVAEKPETVAQQDEAPSPTTPDDSGQDQPAKRKRAKGTPAAG